MEACGQEELIEEQEWYELQISIHEEDQEEMLRCLREKVAYCTYCCEQIAKIEGENHTDWVVKRLAAMREMESLLESIRESLKQVRQLRAYACIDP